MWGVLAIIAGVLAAAAALVVGLLGGFAERQRISDSAPGEWLDLGPVAVRWDDAKAQETSRGWSVSVWGECELQSSSSIDAGIA